jgi:superfamily II DNA or RNA helicase
MILRPYQTKAVSDLRLAISRARTAMLQMPTGGGKTAIFSAITSMADKLDKKVWIVAPRNELVKQASAHLFRHHVSHGKITSTSTESLAYSVHVASRDTLNRRIKAGKIKNWPDLVFIDEAHLALDSQIKLAENLPPECKIIGVTATPERLDNRGLSELYDSLIEGPSILELVQLGFLTNVKYFNPPIVGLDKLHRKGNDYDEDELAELLERKRVFGDAINHYKKYAEKKPTLVFCRSVKASKETADRFQAAGYNFVSIDGEMSYTERGKILDDLGSRAIDGVVSCDLATYGLDVPPIECIIMLRPTMSLPLYMQMLGRGLRPYVDEKTGYVKTHCVILDHVENRRQFFGADGHPFERIDWNFDGETKRKRRKLDGVVSLKICDDCFLHFEGAVCPNCGGTNQNQERKDLQEVDGELVEITGPMKLNDRPLENRREYIDKVAKAVESRDVASLLGLAEDLKNKPTWVYWRLCEGESVVNMEVLGQIASLKGYSRGWLEKQVEFIERRLSNWHR